MTRRDDPRLNGRHPEFSRMSLKPGIGGNFLWNVSSSVLQFNLQNSCDGDVPSRLRHGKTEMPLGRYLTQQLRKQTGKDIAAPLQKKLIAQEEMRPLLEAAKTDPENVSFKSQILKKGKQAALNLEARTKIFKPRKHL